MKDHIMALISLLYVSEGRLNPDTVEADVGAIVARAVRYNPAHGLTGALLFTGVHFAQLLEGSSRDVDTLMLAICDDDRHANVVVVDRQNLDARRFPDWSMAYFGPSQFVSRHVLRLLSDPPPAERRRAARRLAELLHAFATD